MAAGTTSGEATMDRRLLAAAASGDAASMKQLALDPGVLLGTTPPGNTCLHVSCILEHEEFCRSILTLDQSPALVSAVNKDGETPLLAAVTRGHVSVASILLRYCRDQQLSQVILKQDKHGFNALHHAIRRGHTMLALELIEAEPALSKAVNKNDESPMFIAAMRNITDVCEKLLEIPYSAHSGTCGLNALHAAVRNGNAVIAKRIMELRPWLVRQQNENKSTPMHLAVSEKRIDVLKVLLEHDSSLGYLISPPLLCVAAIVGAVGVARELLKHCPDAPYCDPKGSTCLHIAVLCGHMEYVKFILGSQQLGQLVNMQNSRGETALHLAAKFKKVEMLSALRHRQDMDITVLNSAGKSASWELLHATNPAKPLILMADDISSPPEPSGATRSPGNPLMDLRLLEAAASGHAAEMKHMAVHAPGVLHGTTPQGNTCLHIASIHGHEEFCKDVMSLSQSLPLLAATNADGETPLVAAVASGHTSLASSILRCCIAQQLSDAILMQDKNGCNALHHAIRSGHRDLALELIEAEPSLSRAVNQYGESPMFIAVMRNHADVFEKLLEIPDSAHGGAYGYNVLHAAVRSGNTAIAKRIMETRPGLAREEDKHKATPMHLAAHWDKVEVLRVLLEHDWSLGYAVSSKGSPVLISAAASRGYVGIARELLKHCPDAPCRVANDETTSTCLQQAVMLGRMELIEFFLDSKYTRKLVNVRDENEETPLHNAVRKCDPKIVHALLRCQDIDVTVLNKVGNPASWLLGTTAHHAKTLNWNEVSMLMLKADPLHAPSIGNLHEQVKNKVTASSRKDIKSLTQTYTGNTSLVAILLATITFAAAFTLPGGYSSDSGNEGLPIMARKFAFQAFLLSDTLAMCSSLVVAFVCIIARWEDLEFLLYYRSFTKKLMWFAYMATTTAFATGLFTVLAPHLLWLAVTICVLTSLLPILTKLLGEWPILELRFRLGRNFKSELLSMI